jgi:hypothetical protein
MTGGTNRADGVGVRLNAEVSALLLPVFFTPIRQRGLTGFLLAV